MCLDILPQPFRWSQTPDQTHHFYGAISCPLEKRSLAIIWSNNTFLHICTAFISHSSITMSLRAAWASNASQARDGFTRAVYAPLTCNLHTRRPSHNSPETLHVCTQVHAWCIVSDRRAVLQRYGIWLGIPATNTDCEFTQIFKIIILNSVSDYETFQKRSQQRLNKLCTDLLKHQRVLPKSWCLKYEKKKN